MTGVADSVRVCPITSKMGEEGKTVGNVAVMA
jgi:hypothetical protein